MNLTKKDVWLTFSYAVLRVFLSVGWIYLMVDNAISREGTIRNVLGAVFGAIAGHYIYETVQWWKRWINERKQLTEHCQRKADTIDG